MLRGQHKKIDMHLTALQKNISKATIAIAKAADALTKRAKDRKDVTNSEIVIVRNLFLTDAISFLGNAPRRDSQNPALPYNVRVIVEMPADCFSGYTGTTQRSLLKKRRNRDGSA